MFFFIIKGKTRFKKLRMEKEVRELTPEEQKEYDLLAITFVID